jgi:pimeloyl-ACP methyl ester carboxylesterase
MTGDADLWTPPSVLRLFARHLPRAESAVIAEAGHSAHWEQPAAFNSALLHFLARHGGA